MSENKNVVLVYDMQKKEYDEWTPSALLKELLRCGGTLEVSKHDNEIYILDRGGGDSE